MATDINQIIDNLLNFYDFKNQTVISVGAGGGQFIDYGYTSKHVFAIDNDKGALGRLEDNLKEYKLQDKFTLVHSDFHDSETKGDLVMFEFCLHEIKNPVSALSHALTMASNILIIDHWLDSEWAYIVDEEIKVSDSWNAVLNFKIKKIRKYKTFQYFNDYDELFQKVKIQGHNSIKRIKKYEAMNGFSIPMSYCFALL